MWASFATLLMVIGQSFAQVNTEKYRPSEAEDGLSGALAVGVAIKQGNVEMFDAKTDASLQWRRDATTLFLVGNGQFAAKRTISEDLEEGETALFAEESRYANKKLAHFRVNQALTEAVSAEVFTQIQQDQFLLLDQRLLGGVGPRFRVLEGDAVSGHVGVAYLYEFERLDVDSIATTEQVETVAHRASTYVTGDVSLDDDLALRGTVYFQPLFADFSDFRVLGEGGLQVGLNKWLALKVGVTFRYDSLPPILAEGSVPLESMDLALANSLSISF